MRGRRSSNSPQPNPGAPNPAATGNGGELHQRPAEGGLALTTNQGIVVADNQNSLKGNPRGPTLLEDFILREKITHFDHERIPERIVHARGSGAHGYFETTQPLGEYTKADFLQRAGEKTPVFVRFSTVAGGAGSGDLPRDVRGFATKFYTKEGNFDLVGNNIPVFFIQDAMKFPDLVHSVKMEPDRGYPQAASAHDTFWDFVSLMPESMHMIMWAMSDRAIPRSLRMIEGFGVNTFRLVNAEGKATFVKFHWRPTIGMQSVVWDEAVKINGADPDFHRRDLFEAIESGDFPEWQLGLQLFDEQQAAGFDFDVLDATKLIPEELVPLKIVGRLVLNRNPDNFFAETEQVAFCPANVVPGIDFSNDPLLQGRLFSYLDTQLIRLGGPNFHQIPINAPKCPWHNLQRDGHMQTLVPKGRVSYEPNTLMPQAPRAEPSRGFTGLNRPENGDTMRLRPESFADHFTQARLFFMSQTEPEQNHIISALVFELSKVEIPAIRERVVSQLMNIDQTLAQRVAKGLRLEGELKPAETAVPAKDNLQPSPALSIIGKAPETLKGRVVGALVSDGADRALIDALRRAVEREGAKLKLIAPHVGGIKTAESKTAEGEMLKADMRIDGGPSIFFDAVALIVSEEGAQELAGESAAINFIADAFNHLKVIGHVPAAEPLLRRAGVTAELADEGVVAIANGRAVAGFIAAAKKMRIWNREPKVRNVP
ncbi:MAG: catalase [Alphaproteobacteria bacterium]|nr:catalase [Alphaproteobacteria bacterium]MBV9860831.1 catalase [Alphaproteobacteria bacterium]